MTGADISTQRPGRLAIALLVIVLHIAAIAGLIRAFAPGLATQVAEQVVTAFTVEVTTVPTKPAEPPAARSEKAPAPVASRSTPREVAAPRPRIAIAVANAPAAAGRGSDNAAGAGVAGDGTGAGGQGAGTGGGDVARKLEKIAGDISSSRDFPRKTRALRNGHAVVVQIEVGTDGRARGCRVVRPSPDTEADAIVCQLAQERFRFRPRLDGDGNPVAASYQWQQRWWDPRIEGLAHEREVKD